MLSSRQGLCRKLVVNWHWLTIQGLYGMGLQRFAPWIGLTLAVVCITMNTVLIPRMGVAAVCISWIAAEVLECVLSGTILMIKGKKER